VESVLIEHPGVAEAGVIGKPDPVAGDIVKAFVSLKPGYEASDALRRELLGFARQRLGAVVAPKEIAFLDTLPRTRSGKIMRRLLRARELGLPEGDTSTMEGN
jgi:acetyl-CoA synthetase